MIYEITSSDLQTLDELLKFATENGAALLKKDTRRLTLSLRGGSDAVIPYAQSKSCLVNEQEQIDVDPGPPREQELMSPPQGIEIK